MENNRTVKERDMGIELLRMVSMLMVVVLHVLGKGGILERAAMEDVWGEARAGYAVSYLLETLCLCAVNCYALVSGYVGADGRFRYARLFETQIRVLFYTVSITIVFFICKPEIFGLTLVRNAFFPALTQQYWYYTGYFGLMLLMPALDILIAKIPRRTYAGLIAAAVLMFSVLPTIFVSDIFYIRQGYSLWWLAALYLIGAYIKKYGCYLFAKKRLSVLVYAGCVVLTFGANVLQHIKEELPVPELSVYSSPTVLLAAVALLSVFAGIKVTDRLRKILALLAPCAFSVYLIHAHPLIWKYLLEDQFTELALKPILLIPAVIAIAILIYALCTLIDLLRAWMFSICRVKELCRRLGAAADKLFGGDVQ